MTPRDDYAFVGDPPMMRPEATEVHISVTFVWDRSRGEHLARAWRQYYPIVKLGGPAYDDHGNGFIPGQYVMDGVIFSSRGCNKRCPWCFAWRREGRIRLLPIKPGHIIQDNNLLQCPRDHQEAVYRMLQRQSKAAEFKGGLDATRVDDWVASQLRELRISQVFLAADTDHSLRPLEKAVRKLSFLARDKLRCYVLLAYDGESIGAGLRRLEAVWGIGCLPFAQLYQPPEEEIQYSKEWEELARTWSRPAATKAAGALLDGVEHRGMP